jgi:GT2 family glycosyltransferase
MPLLLPPSNSADTLVSVIVPVYNGARFLGDAIGNILGQGYPSIEIIVGSLIPGISSR